MDADIETGQFGKAVGDREMTMAPVDELMQQPTEVSSVFYHGGQKHYLQTNALFLIAQHLLNLL